MDAGWAGSTEDNEKEEVMEAQTEVKTKQETPEATAPPAEEAKSLPQHLQVVAPYRDQSEQLTEVKEPDIPIPTFLDELASTVLAAEQHRSGLETVGLPAHIVPTLIGLMAALRSAQALWQAERIGGRSEETQATLEEAETTRSDVLSAGDLALRGSTDGQRRLAAIREGEGIADLLADLTDLAAVVLEFGDAFRVIRLDVDGTATELVTIRSRLQKMLAEEDVAKTITGSKELRDRIYTLAVLALSELRAFASYAFRKDRSPRRRAAFFSAYSRSRTRRSRTGSTTGEETAPTVSEAA